MAHTKEKHSSTRLYSLNLDRWSWCYADRLRPVATGYDNGQMRNHYVGHWTITCFHSVAGCCRSRSLVSFALSNRLYKFYRRVATFNKLPPDIIARSLTYLLVCSFRIPSVHRLYSEQTASRPSTTFAWPLPQSGRRIHH